MIRCYFLTRQCSCPNCKDNQEVACEVRQAHVLAWSESRFEPYSEYLFHIKLKLTGIHFSTTYELFETLSGKTLTIFVQFLQIS